MVEEGKRGVDGEEEKQGLSSNNMAPPSCFLVANITRCTYIQKFMLWNHFKAKCTGGICQGPTYTVVMLKTGCWRETWSAGRRRKPGAWKGC